MAKLTLQDRTKRFRQNVRKFRSEKSADELALEEALRVELRSKGGTGSSKSTKKRKKTGGKKSKGKGKVTLFDKLFK